MQGHKRKNGSLVCPGEASIFTVPVSSTRKSHSTPLPSPPASPGGSPPVTPLSYGGFLPVDKTPVFEPPPGDRWHWKNPNWVSPPQKMRLYTPDDEDRGSLTPTEPVTEPAMNVIPEEQEGSSSNVDEEEDVAQQEEWEYFTDRSSSLSARPWSPFSQSPVTDIGLNTALRASTPLFKVFRTPLQDLDSVRRTAQREGKHIAVISAPLAHRAMATVPTDRADDTAWVVVSDSIEDLKYAIDSQQAGMPGTFFPEEPKTRGMGFFQVVVAGVLGGLTVAVGLACL